ncbi:hypothetical protein JTB14_030719 [Gonioctena quinquepunctata]|nr:hypothetical protein JTB14_030719 [Gonioctena quinquepunctata]
MSSLTKTSAPASLEKLEGSGNYIDWIYGMEIHLVNFLGVGNLNPNEWYIGRGDWLENTKALKDEEVITTASGEKFDIAAVGKTVCMLINGNEVEAPICDMKYALGLKIDSISCR